MQLPPIAQDWALFLDLDGTLIDIAPRPDAVTVPQGLVESLGVLEAGLGGALAIVSGRPAEGVDYLLAPLRLAGGFGHGAELRLPGGTLRAAGPARELPAGWLARLAAETAEWPGVLVEPKRHGVTVHFRLAPEREGAVRSLLAGLAAGEAGFELLPAAMAFELRPVGATKALPVETLMAMPPFSGRCPVFVGDDVTDEDGMAAARRLGGLGLHVGRDFGGDPGAVRGWLARGVA